VRCSLDPAELGADPGGGRHREARGDLAEDDGLAQLPVLGDRAGDRADRLQPLGRHRRDGRVRVDGGVQVLVGLFHVAAALLPDRPVAAGDR